MLWRRRRPRRRRRGLGTLRFRAITLVVVDELFWNVDLILPTTKKIPI